jgi:hypothetical protein
LDGVPWCAVRVQVKLNREPAIRAGDLVFGSLVAALPVVVQKTKPTKGMTLEVLIITLNPQKGTASPTN